MTLRAADALRLGTNASATITYGVERTRLDLSARTELKLVSLTRGKHFMFQAGRIKASVARPRLLEPMVLIAPQAEAQVLGTKLTLTAETNATRLEVTEGNVELIRKRDDAAVKVGAGHYAVAATNVELTAQPLTGRIFREELGALGWDGATLAQWPKGDARKVRIAHRLWTETSVTFKWLAEQLLMGAWTHVANRLSRKPTQPNNQSDLDL